MEALSLENVDRQTLRAALHVAATNNHAGVVSILLRAGAHFGSSDSVLYAALHHDSADALRTLIEAKLYVNGLNSSGRFTVAAAGHGAMKCLRVLALDKADLSLADTAGVTPASAAAARGCVDIVHLLVHGKADIDGADRWGHTPVFMAAYFGHMHIVHMLIQAKADATRCADYSNASPLLLAAAGGHAAGVRCLLAHAPALAAVATRRGTFYLDVEITAGSRPLDVARQFGHNDVVSLLVAAMAGR